MFLISAGVNRSLLISNFSSLVGSSGSAPNKGIQMQVRSRIITN